MGKGDDEARPSGYRDGDARRTASSRAEPGQTGLSYLHPSGEHAAHPGRRYAVPYRPLVGRAHPCTRCGMSPDAGAGPDSRALCRGRPPRLPPKRARPPTKSTLGKLRVPQCRSRGGLLPWARCPAECAARACDVPLASGGVPALQCPLARDVLLAALQFHGAVKGPERAAPDTFAGAWPVRLALRGPGGLPRFAPRTRTLASDFSTVRLDACPQNFRNGRMA